MGTFNLLALGYLLLGGYTLYRLGKEWRLLVDPIFTRRDRELASMVALFLLTPVAVLLHEVGHYVAATWAGAVDVQLHYRLYWGFVTFRYSPAQVDATQLFLINAAGPGVQVLLGYGAFFLGLYGDLRAAYRYILVVFGLLSVVWALAVYPLMDFLGGLNGDFSQLYGPLGLGQRVAVGALHAALLGGIVLWAKRPNAQGVLR